MRVSDIELTGDLPVLGIDPGARWTAGVLRVGSEPVYGWTVGPVGAAGQLDKNAADDVDDLAALARYTARVIDQADATIDLAKHQYGRCRIAVEMLRVPTGYRYGRPSKIALGDWLTPRSIVVALLTMYEGAVLVPADQHGRAERTSYPRPLQFRRPADWGPNDHPRHERDHERAAFDIAGVGARMPVARRTTA